MLALMLRLSRDFIHSRAEHDGLGWTVVSETHETILSIALPMRTYPGPMDETVDGSAPERSDVDSWLPSGWVAHSCALALFTRGGSMLMFSSVTLRAPSSKSEGVLPKGSLTLSPVQHSVLERIQIVASSLGCDALGAFSVVRFTI